jgi:hypothetical protein
MKPDRVVVLRGGVAPGDDPRGSAGEIGRGPVIAEGDTWLAERAAAAAVPVQTVAAARLAVNASAAYPAIPMHVIAVPVQFAQTPVEVADGWRGPTTRQPRLWGRSSRSPRNTAFPVMKVRCARRC